MTEVKNSSVDLLSRQMTGSKKKEEKAVNGQSEFKAMLKNGNQKKDGKSPESGESSEDKMSASEVASEAAALVVAAGMAGIKEPEEKFQMAGQEPTDQIMETIGEAEATVLSPEESGKIQTMDSFRTLDQFRFNQLAESSMGTDSLADVKLGTLTDNSKEIAEPLFSKTMMQKTGEKNPVIEDIAGQNPETAVNAKGKNDTLSLQQLMKAAETVSDSVEEEPMVNLQRSGSQEKSNPWEEDQDKIQKSLPEKPYEPVRFWNTSSAKPEEVHMSVRVDNSEELEAKLSEQILKQIHEGNGELDIQLEPHNLGKIRIRISYEDNQISVSLLCTESRTLKLLSQSAGDLGSILESNLERPFQVLVDKQEPDYLNQQQEQGSRQEQRGQHQESQREENSGDFLQKLRLGIFESESTEESGVGYR
ncbi:hook-length control protein FliK [Lacrimispora sphenoides]|jgi:flagellar hook-length control protein FliK|uniref:flagellar hook-length control protein FliK n=1 Tax=Lacrimispora sphenoides TaxID=29370 RepID=UPI0008B38576|nr:flagellar hook-length control protein FliK [Lacrimispora sphenoides]SET95200.1 hook-length control protein FliK [Lacrimispora sphenoides]